MSATLCRRFTLGDRAWEIDLMSLSINDTIVLQELTGRTWARILTGLDDGDAVVIKAVWWAARRASGEDIEIDSDDMNPLWASFSTQPISHLTAPEEPAATTPAAKPKPAPKKVPANKR